jgi:ABC-type multidrug transport system fused ATPase/permease subunit
VTSRSGFWNRGLSPAGIVPGFCQWKVPHGGSFNTCGEQHGLAAPSKTCPRGALVIGGGGGAGVAAGILGVIAGTTATRAAGFAYGELVATVPKVKAYRTLLAQIDNETDRIGQEVTHTAEGLSATDVTVTYPGQGRPALTGFNLNVEVGSMVVLVGVNGAGKPPRST